MKELLKIIVFISGLIFLGGLAICFGAGIFEDLSFSHTDYEQQEKQRRLNYLTELKAKADSTPVNGMLNWQYSQILKTPEAKDALGWSDEKIKSLSMKYLKKSQQANTIEGIAQTGYDQLLTAFGYQHGDSTQLSSHHITNPDALDTGLNLIQRATKHQCTSHFMGIYSHHFDDDFIQEGNVIDYAAIASLIHNPNLKKHPVLLEKAKVLWLHNQVNCATDYRDIKKELIEHLVDSRGDISYDYVLATLINEPDLAYLFKRAATKNATASEKANFNKNVNNMMTLFKKDYTGFVSAQQKQEAQCCQDKNNQDNKTDELTS